MTVVEAVVGALLVLSVAGGFVLADGGAPPAREAALDRQAADALTLLLREPLSGGPTLADALASSATFDRNRTAVEARLAALLPEGAFFRLTTPHGAVGDPRLRGVPTGHAARATGDGSVRLRVWYG
jgi:hypothetical protein